MDHSVYAYLQRQTTQQLTILLETYEENCSTEIEKKIKAYLLEILTNRGALPHKDETP